MREREVPNQPPAPPLASTSSSFVLCSFSFASLPGGASVSIPSRALHYIILLPPFIAVDLDTWLFGFPNFIGYLTIWVGNESDS